MLSNYCIKPNENFYKEFDFFLLKYFLEELRSEFCSYELTKKMYWMACYSTCKKNAIQISQNTKGFYIPLIDDSLCVGCHQCEHVCPELSEISKSKWEKCYAGWTKNDSVREKSSSGGLFFRWLQ